MEAPAPGRDPDEALALAQTAELALAGARRIVEPDDLAAACAARGLPHPRWFRAMGALRDQGLVQLRTGSGDHVQLLALTDGGLLAHLGATRADLAEAVARTWRAAQEAAPGQAVALPEVVREPPLLVEVLLEQWARAGRLVYAKAPGGRFRIHRVDSGDAPAPG